MVVQEPVGVVSAIAAWNGPLLQMASKVGPALVAGCTVIMKPSEQTPMEALMIAECAEAVGIPPGVLNLVTLGREALTRSAKSWRLKNAHRSMPRDSLIPKSEASSHKVMAMRS